MSIRAGHLGMVVALLSFQAVAQTQSTNPTVEETSVTCEGFRRIEDGQRWVVLWPITITIGGKSINLTPRHAHFSRHAVGWRRCAGVLEKIC
jgi:hypothetical protein